MGMMNAFDKAWLAGQSAAKTFGIIPRTAAGIREVRRGDALYAEFAVALESGWPGFRIQLPEGVLFRQAVTGMYLRSGLWRTAQTPRETTLFFEATLQRMKAPFHTRHRGRSRTLVTHHLGGEVRIRIVERSRERTQFSITQRRQQGAEVGAGRRVLGAAPQPSHVS